MPIHNANNMAFLDGIRHKHGNEGLKNVFHEAIGHDADKAVRLINDNRILFPTLFVLRPEIVKVGLHPHLNARNNVALALSDDILSGNLAAEHRGRETDKAVLSWMLHSGYRSDGMNEHYDVVLDNAALLLARVHGDKHCLRPIEELIFSRHRKGAYNYDLVWAFFEASEPEDLLLLANRLQSPDIRDVELARQLLNFIPCIESENNPVVQYRCSHKWIRQNRDRLYYTGESNQQRSNPSRYALAPVTQQYAYRRHTHD